MSNQVVVEISARHVHVSQADLETLFGKGYELTCKKITIPASVVQICGGDTSSTVAPIANLESLEELVIKGGLKEELDDVPLIAVRYCNALKTLEIDCDSAELPEDWIVLNQDTYNQMTVICPDDSEAAKWAEKKGIKHKEK